MCESKVWLITKVRCNQSKYLVNVGAQLQLHVMSSADVIEEDCSRLILPGTRCKINMDQIWLMTHVPPALSLSLLPSLPFFVSLPAVEMWQRCMTTFCTNHFVCDHTSCQLPTTSWRDYSRRTRMPDWVLVLVTTSERVGIRLMKWIVIKRIVENVGVILAKFSKGK